MAESCLIVIVHVGLLDPLHTAADPVPPDHPVKMNPEPGVAFTRMVL